MKLSNQALGSIMMALQRSLLTQTDCTEILREFNLQLNENEELIVLNPPTVQVDFDQEDQEDQEDPERIYTRGSD